MTLAFRYEPTTTAVLFGEDSTERLPDELSRLRATKVMVICTPGRRGAAEAIGRALGSRLVGLFPQAAMHVPIETVQSARAEARRLGADAIVTLGGGSAIDLAKAVAFDVPLVTLAIPTTYSGAELTPFYGVTEAGIKRTYRELRVVPRVVIYDPCLTLGLPAEISATSGLNALAHCLEGLYAPDLNPAVTALALEGVRRLVTSLPGVIARPDDRALRAEALCGAWLAASVVSAVKMGLHHRLCAILGGSYQLPHAAVHAALLPHVMAFNAAAAPDALAAAAAILGQGRIGRAVFDFATALGIEMALGRLGLRESDLDRVAAAALEAAPYHPRAATPDRLRALLRDAWAGRRPET